MSGYAETQTALLIKWLRDFADCVRRKDIVGGKALFADDVVAFGTRNEMLIGLPALVESQWSPTWSATRDFDFDDAATVTGIAADSSVAWIATTWSSQAISDGRLRRGRASFALTKTDAWTCVHSHLSYLPTGGL